VRPAVNSGFCWLASHSGPSNVWGDNIVLDEGAENCATLSGTACTVQETVIHSMIGHINFVAVGRLGSPDSIPEQSTKLKVVSSHGGLNLWDWAQINHVGTGCRGWCRPVLEKVPLLEQVLEQELDWGPQWEFRCRHCLGALQATWEESKTGC